MTSLASAVDYGATSTPPWTHAHAHAGTMGSSSDATGVHAKNAALEARVAALCTHIKRQEQAQADVTSSLHSEIERLQHVCNEYTFKMLMNGISPADIAVPTPEKDRARALQAQAPSPGQATQSALSARPSQVTQTTQTDTTKGGLLSDASWPHAIEASHGGHGMLGLTELGLVNALQPLALGASFDAAHGGHPHGRHGHATAHARAPPPPPPGIASMGEPAIPAALRRRLEQSSSLAVLHHQRLGSPAAAHALSARLMLSPTPPKGALGRQVHHLGAHHRPRTAVLGNVNVAVTPHPPTSGRGHGSPPHSAAGGPELDGEATPRRGRHLVALETSELERTVQSR